MHVNIIRKCCPMHNGQQLQCAVNDLQMSLSYENAVCGHGPVF